MSFFDEIVVDLQTATTLPIDCTRLEMRSAEDFGIVLILRTNPELTQRIFMVAPYQYPVTLVHNHMIVFGILARHLEHGVVIPALSEITRAATVSAPDEYGAQVDGENGILSVPHVKFPIRRSAPERIRRWGEILLDDPHHPLSQDRLRAVMDIHLVHMPDIPVRELQEEQLLHIARLTYGWNYVAAKKGREGRGYIEQIARLYQLAAQEARIVTTYR